MLETDGCDPVGDWCWVDGDLLWLLLPLGRLEGRRDPCGEFVVLALDWTRLTSACWGECDAYWRREVEDGSVVYDADDTGA